MAAPLTPAEIEELDRRAIAAQRAFAEAMARRNAEQQKLDVGFMQGVGRLSQGFQAQRNVAGSTLASKGLMFSPGAAGRAVRQMRNDQAAQQAQLRNVRTEGISQLAQMVTDAERQKAEEMAAIARMRAQLGGQYNRLIPGLG
jgi:hypothetical protein